VDGEHVEVESPIPFELDCDGQRSSLASGRHVLARGRR
jgi:hypothetical protein